MLSKKQSRVYQFYKNFINKKWYCPTYKEAGEILWIRQSVVFYHISNLIKKWFIIKTYDKKLYITEIKKNNNINLFNDWDKLDMYLWIYWKIENNKKMQLKQLVKLYIKNINKAEKILWKKALDLYNKCILYEKM